MCPNGWKKFNNHSCFWISNSQENFKNARNTCIGKGGKLATISTKDEYRFVSKQLYNGTENIDAWIGLHKKANTEKFTYNSSNTEPNYGSLGVMFIPEDLITQNEYCVTILVAKDETIWKAKQCDQKLLSYVCQTKVYKGKNDRNFR